MCVCVSVRAHNTPVSLYEWVDSADGRQLQRCDTSPSCTDISADILGFATHPRPPGKVMAVAAAVATCPPPPNLTPHTHSPAPPVNHHPALAGTPAGPQSGPGWTHYSTRRRTHHMTRLTHTPHTPTLMRCRSLSGPRTPNPSHLKLGWPQREEREKTVEEGGCVRYRRLDNLKTCLRSASATVLRVARGKGGGGGGGGNCIKRAERWEGDTLWPLLEPSLRAPLGLLSLLLPRLSLPPVSPPPPPRSSPPTPRALWCVAHSIVSAFRSAQFEWQAVTDQFPAKAARQAGVTGQEGI